jgi:uncharacterized glyoxalase superfamily protein PhnB
MLKNRSIQESTVIPVLAYPDVHEAAAWLAAAFGFRVRLRIGDHRVQMTVPGGGGVTLRERRPGDEGATPGRGQSVTVRVDDADAHCRRAREHGARITQEPATHPYGERQYNAEDPAGYAWTFSQTVADADPAEWGGEAVEL